MRFGRYPEYKESDVEWIGEIPTHWETKAIWMMFHLGRGRVISNEEIVTNPGQYPVYSSQTEDKGIMGHIDTYDFDGDYITWTTDGAKAGTVFYRTGQFNCTNVCGTLAPRNPDLDLRFFRHALNVITSRFVRYDINPKLMNNVMAKIRVQVPSETEQRQIADFLDCKTEQIDELIRIKERRIELLQEQRTALINQTVTKGLNPNVKMKPSGVEWIGKIPAHWKVVRNKHLFGNRNQRGYEGEPLLSVTQDQGVLPRNELDYRVWNPDKNIELYKLVMPGDWVISLRTFEGGIELSEVRGIVSPAYTTMFPRKQILNSYFKYFLKSVNFIAELNRITTGIRQGKNISYEDFSDTKIAFPPLSEQKVIGNFLNRKTQQIDELIATEQRKIELLKEYRQSLISEAVTGKIDVRNEV